MREISSSLSIYPLPSLSNCLNASLKKQYVKFVKNRLYFNLSLSPMSKYYYFPFFRLEIKVTARALSFFDNSVKGYNIQYTIYNIQYTIYNIQYTIYNIQYTIYNIQYTIYNIQYTIYNIQYTLYNIQYTIYNIHMREIRYPSL